MRRRPQWDWSKVFSVRAEDLVRPTPAFARHYLGLLASVVRPITILLFLLVPTVFWFGSGHLFPDRHVVELDDGRILEVLERTTHRAAAGWAVTEDEFILQYLSDVTLSEPSAVERRAHEILAVYAGPEADAESCTKIELIATEWCDNGLCYWQGQVFVAARDDDGNWEIVESYSDSSDANVIPRPHILTPPRHAASTARPTNRK